ncbi:MAG: hypothetical protein LBN34_06245 [Clostridiales Family XIII bacterium]|jgi:hypothetical protein|nr:hypothetical protein [Clostridiales Family XIII bacterium]
MEIKIEDVEVVKTETGCTYKEAKEALESSNNDTANAIMIIIELKNQKARKNLLDTVASSKGAEALKNGIGKGGEVLKDSGAKVMSSEKAKKTKKILNEAGAEIMNTMLAKGAKRNAEKVGSSIRNTGEKIGESNAEVLDSKLVKGVKQNVNKMGDAIADTGDKIGEVGAEVFNAKLLQSTMDEYKPVWEEYDRESVVLELSCDKLHRDREQSILEIANIESLVNSIANTPKSFDDDFAKIKLNIDKFHSAEHLAVERLEDLKKSAGVAGAGITAGVGVATLAPTAAIAIATTFGTASTGTAISALGGAAATNAALAWLGGGAVAAGGGGVAAGNALLVLAGPIGWSIAGASILGSGVLMSYRNKKKAAELHELTITLHERLKDNRAIQVKIEKMIESTNELTHGIHSSYEQLSDFIGFDYGQLDSETQLSLGALVNNTNALSAHINSTIEENINE